jgi:enterochelin esterase family protein
MGGGQAITIGFRNLDRFSAIGSFSGAVPRENAEELAKIFRDPDRVNQRLKLFWLGCGRDDSLVERNEAFAKELAERRIRHELHLTDGVHNYAVWRRYLAEYVPQLFPANNSPRVTE